MTPRSGTASVALSVALSVTLLAVPAAQAPPRFEVASIRPSPPQPPTQGTAGVRITARQARFSFLSLKDYIGLAHNVRVYQIIAPDWIAGARFEIAATIPDGLDGKSVSAMMAALLEERFHMKAHRETREFPVYALETLPEFALAPVTVEAPAGNAYTVTSTSGPGGTAVDLGDGAALLLGGNRLELRKVTFVQLASALERFVDRPVVEAGGREGRFNVTLELAPQDFQAAMMRAALASGTTLPPPAMRLLDAASPAAVPDALKASGLTLRPRRAPLEVLVVDSIDRAPTED